MPVFTGTPDAEEISGTIIDDTITGSGGDDTIFASWGNDLVYGEAGDDEVTVDRGNDTIIGYDAGNGYLLQGSDTVILIGSLKDHSFNVDPANGRNRILSNVGDPQQGVDTLGGIARITFSKDYTIALQNELSMSNPSLIDITTVTAIRVLETNSGATTLRVPVIATNLLASKPGDSITLTYAIAGGSTAQSGSDYSAPLTGEVTLTGGASVGFIDLSILGDSSFEADETVNITLGFKAASIDGRSVTAADINFVAGQNITVTVANDDASPPPQLSVTDVSVTEGNDGTRSANFVVKLNVAQASDVTFVAATAGDSAEAGVDFQSVSGTYTIKAGQTEVTVSVPVIGDTVNESSETFHLNISKVNGAIPPSRATATILNDDDGIKQPTPSISVANGTAAEGDGTVTFTVSLSNPTVETVTFSYATTGVTAVAGQDFTSISGTGVIQAGQTSTQISVPILNDSVAETLETLRLTISSAAGATVDTQDGTIFANGSITDDDVPVVTVQAGSAAEGAGTMTFEVKLSTASSQTVTVGYQTMDGAAVGGVDFHPGKGTVTFNPGQTTATVTVDLIDDLLSEGAETFTLSLSAPVGAAFAGNASSTSANGTISDNDTPLITVVPGAVTEAGKLATFSVSLSGPSATDVTFDYKTVSGTAKAGTDFKDASGTVTIKAGQTTADIQLEVTDDKAAEGAEGFTLSLTNAKGGVFANQASAIDLAATIVDDDKQVAKPTATVTLMPVRETEAARLTVTLPEAATSDVTFTIVTGSGTATKGVDFLSPDQTVTIKAGQTSASVNVVAIGDLSKEGPETYSLTLSSPDDTMAFTQSTFTGRIIDGQAVPEVLLLDGDGDLLAWDSGRGANGFTALLTLNPQSRILAAADFSGTGKNGLLFDVGGTGLIWDPSKGASGFSELKGVSGMSFLGAGDLDGAAGADLLFQKNGTGELYFYDGKAGGITPFLTMDAGFSVVGIGRVDADQADDILFKTAGGSVFYWNGSAFADLLTLDGDTELVAIGDFRGDSAAELLFFNKATRSMLFWTASQGEDGFADFLTLTVGWNTLATKDVNGDGVDDVVFQDASTRQTIYWTGNGFQDLGDVLSEVSLVGVSDIL